MNRRHRQTVTIHNLSDFPCKVEVLSRGNTQSLSRIAPKSSRTIEIPPSWAALEIEANGFKSRVSDICPDIYVVVKDEKGVADMPNSSVPQAHKYWCFLLVVCFLMFCFVFYGFFYYLYHQILPVWLFKIRQKAKSKTYHLTFQKTKKTKSKKAKPNHFDKEKSKKQKTQQVHILVRLCFQCKGKLWDLGCECIRIQYPKDYLCNIKYINHIESVTIAFELVY